MMLYVRFPLSLRNVEDLLHERGIEVSHGTVRRGWQQLIPMPVAGIIDTDGPVLPKSAARTL